jgi:hypothetical protein
MKFGKIIVLGGILAVSAPLAFADTITFSQSGTDTVSLSSTGITFKNTGGATTFTDPAGAPGKVVSTSANSSLFSVFTTSSIVKYDPSISGLSNTAMHFDGTGNADAPSVGTPIQFLVVTIGGVTMDLFITSTDSHTLGNSTTPAGFTATGYITETGHTGDIPVTFSLTESGPKNGTNPAVNTFTDTITTDSSFTTTVAPEPSSLILMGTGILSMAGIGFRKRKIA